MPPWSPLIPLKLNHNNKLSPDCPPGLSSLPRPTQSTLGLQLAYQIPPVLPQAGCTHLKCALCGLTGPQLTWSPLVHLKLSHGQFVHRLVSNLSPYLFIANATGLGLSASSSFWSLMWSDMVLRTKAAVQGDPPLAEAHLTNAGKYPYRAPDLAQIQCLDS